MLGRKFNNIDEARERAIDSIDRNFSKLVENNMCSPSFDRDFLLGMCCAYDKIDLFDFCVFDVVFNAISAVRDDKVKEII